MQVSVLKPSQAKQQSNDSIYVVVDTFRATTSLSTLKSTGVEKIFVVNNKKQAFQLKQQLCPQCFLIGEEEGLKIKGFDYGNTPSIFANLDFNGKEAIFTSTSGAKALILLKDKKHVYLGSLVNLSVIAEAVREKAKFLNQDIIIVPSGYFKDESVFVIEDWLTAVLLTRKIIENPLFEIVEKEDFWIHTELILSEGNDIKKILLESENSIRLNELGFEKDVKFAIKIDQLNNFLKVKKWLNFVEIKCAVLE